MLEKILKSGAGLILASSLFLQSLQYSGCTIRPPIPKTTQIQDITIPESYAKNPVNLNQEPGNAALFDFPDKIPGVAHIDKFLTPRARKIIIHIRQAHYQERISKQITDLIIDSVEKKEAEESRENVINIQKNIYKSLDFLIKNFNVSQIYVEGLIPRYEALFNNEALKIFAKRQDSRLKEEILRKNLDFYKNQLKEPKIDGVVPKESEIPEYMDFLRKNIKIIEAEIKEAERAKEIFRKFDEENIFANGSYFVLASEGKLKLLASEPIFPDEARRLALEPPPKDKIESIEMKKRRHLKSMLDAMDPRENESLKIITKQLDPLVIIVFGGYHDFKGEFSFGKNHRIGNRFSVCDNIGYYNYLHPKNPLSFIEITPEGYEFFEKKNESVYP